MLRLPPLLLTLAVALVGVCHGNPNLGQQPEQVIRDFDIRFGDAIAIHGGTALIGASEKNGRGSFYVYKEVFGVPDVLWEKEQVVKFDPSFPGFGGADASAFGSSLALYDDVALVGAPHLIPNQHSDPFGAALVFRRNSTGLFDLISDITSPIAVDYRRGSFGYAVAMDEQHLIVSEREAGIEGSYFSVGAVHVYSYSLTGADGLSFNWIQTIFPPDPHDLTWFGSSVDLANGMLVVGEEGRNSVSSSKVGRVYVYLWNGSQFILETGLIPETERGNQFFGSSLALSDDATTLVVGAKGDFQAQDRVGQAFLFDMVPMTPQRTALVPVVGTITADDRYGHAVAISSDGSYIVVGGPGFGKDGIVYAYDNTGGNLAVVKGLFDFGHALAISDDDHYLMVADIAPENYMENVYVWKSQGGSPRPTPSPTIFVPGTTPVPTPLQTFGIGPSTTPPPTQGATTPPPTIVSTQATTPPPTIVSTQATTPPPTTVSTQATTPQPTTTSGSTPVPTPPSGSTPIPTMQAPSGSTTTPGPTMPSGSTTTPGPTTGSNLGPTPSSPAPTAGPGFSGVFTTLEPNSGGALWNRSSFCLLVVELVVTATVSLLLC